MLDADLTGFDASAVYAGSSTVLCVWRCEKGQHTWCATPNRLTNARGGSFCGICAGKIIIPGRSLAAVAPWLADEWDLDANSSLNPWRIAPNDNRKYYWKCPVADDHRWQASPNNRYGKGSRCRMCTGKEASSTNNMMLYPHLIQEWDHEKNALDGLEPDKLTYGAKVEANWICQRYPAGHRWPAPVYKRSAGSGCPFCSSHEVSSLNSLAEQQPELAKQFDIPLNGKTPDTVSVSSNDRTIWWRCPVEPAHHVWQAQPNNRVAGRTGCPDCNTPGKSAQEVRLAYELASELHFSPTQHVIRDGSGGTMIVDMILPDQRLIIEFDGSYWHADKVEKDDAKARQLRKDGWTVIRVREHPLSLLDEKFDVLVPLKAPPHEAASVVFEHMETLGLAPTGTAKSYTTLGAPAAAREAEEELARIRSRRTA